MNKTIVYYTSNREYESFENGIKQTIIDNSNGLPIISVSQKPIDFGTNICVGDIGTSEINICRQLLIGAEAATTDFVIPCESDILYPPDFFSFEPLEDDTFYYAEEAYIAWHSRNTFYRKRMQEFTSVVSRLHLIKTLDYLIENKSKRFSKTIRTQSKYDTFKTIAPLVTIKTDRQLHKRHPFSKNNKLKSLLIWGTAKELWEKYPLRSNV